jgi:uncharacterized protein
MVKRRYEIMPVKVHCPICKKSISYEGNPFRPFCSERCKKRDLGAWASGEYVVSGKGNEVEEENISTSEESNEGTEGGTTDRNIS